MNDEKKSNPLLLAELSEAHRQIAELRDEVFKHRQEEAVLREREAFFRSLFENAIQGVFQTTIAGQIAMVNPAMAHMLGYASVQEAMDKITDISGQVYADPHERNALLERLIQEENITGSEVFFKKIDGRQIKVMLNLHLVRDKDGKPSFIQGSCIDITARWLAEEALRGSERKVRAVFDVSFELMGLLDTDGTVLDANRTALEFVGAQLSDVVGKPLWETPWWSHSIDMQERLRMAITQAARGKPMRFEATHPCIDGKIHRIDFTLKPLTDDNGRVARLIPEGRDITEHKEAEEELRKSAERYRTIFEQTGNASVLIAEDTTIVLANSNFEKLSGYSKQEIEGKLSWTFFVDQKDLERMKQYHELRRKESIRTPPPNSYEFRFINRQGEKRDIFLSTALIPGTKINIASLMDISERKQAEEALRKSEELYTRLVDTIPDIVVRTDLDGDILFVNDYTLRISGYSRKDLEGRNIRMFIVPEEQGKAFEDTLLMKHARLVPQEYQMIMSDGGQRLFEISGDVLKNENGAPFGLVYVCRDISERKRAEEKSRQSEEKFTKVFMTAPIGIAITRIEDGLIVDTNLGFKEITGWNRNEVLGRTSLEVNFWADSADRAYLVSELRAGRDVLQREFLFKRKDGTVGNGIYSARSIQIAGEADIIFSLQDITDQRMMEKEHRKLEQQLFQSQKMESVGRLAGGVAHDFNNMLSVIIGNTEMAMYNVDPSSPIYKLLEEILNAGKRSAELTRQLLAFARKQTAIPRVMDLNEMVPGMLKMLQRLIGEDINLVWMPGEDLWKVRIDPSQVDQLLANLMVNARDAIDKAGKIVIETCNTFCDERFCIDKPECAPGEYVMLAVSDDGCGMEKEILTNIFEPFFTTKKEGQGTGLGLATVYGIVRQNGGFINVYSEPGKGTTFKIHLPRHNAESQEAANDKAEKKLQRGTETVLIVEDEEVVMNLSRRMFEELGYRVIAFKKPDEAIRWITDHDEHIDLLMTDIVMPDMNGRELSKRITSIKPDIKCLFMSGYTADVIARQGILDERLYFIQKPFSLKELAVKVREVLE